MSHDEPVSVYLKATARKIRDAELLAVIGAAAVGPLMQSSGAPVALLLVASLVELWALLRPLVEGEAGDLPAHPGKDDGRARMADRAQTAG